LRIDCRAELVAEDEIIVDVDVAGRFPLEELPLPMGIERRDGVGVQADRPVRALGFESSDRRAAACRYNLRAYRPGSLL
jgi:hypothetical protein